MAVPLGQGCRIRFSFPPQLSRRSACVTPADWYLQRHWEKLPVELRHPMFVDASKAVKLCLLVPAGLHVRHDAARLKAARPALAY